MKLYLIFLILLMSINAILMLFLVHKESKKGIRKE